MRDRRVGLCRNCCGRHRCTGCVWCAGCEGVCTHTIQYGISSQPWQCCLSRKGLGCTESECAWIFGCCASYVGPCRQSCCIVCNSNPGSQQYWLALKQLLQQEEDVTPSLVSSSFLDRLLVYSSTFPWPEGIQTCLFFSFKLASGLPAPVSPLRVRLHSSQSFDMSVNSGSAACPLITNHQAPLLPHRHRHPRLHLHTNRNRC